MAKQAAHKASIVQTAIDQHVHDWETTLSAFADASVDGFVLFDRTLNLIGMNPSVLRLVNLSNKVAIKGIGKNLLDLMPGIRETGRYDAYVRVIETGQPFFAEEVVPQEFGGLRLSVKAFKVGDGLGLLISDMTKEAKLRESLRASEERHRAIIETSVDGIYQVDASGEFVFVNESLAKMFGYQREELIGTHFSSMLSDQTLARVTEMVQEVMSGKSVRDEVPVRHKDGHEVQVMFSATPLRQDGRVVGLTGILKDITERKRAELLLNTQRDLATRLSSAATLDDGLRACLETALAVSQLDCGGVYLLDDESGTLDLVHHRGLSPDFVRAVGHYDTEAPNVKLIMAGKSVYADYSALGMSPSDAERLEGPRAIAIMPLFHEGRVIGCLNVSSHTLDEIPARSRAVLEAIAAQIGGAIARLRSEQQLQRARREWEDIFEAIGNPAMTIDPEHTILTANRATVEATGKAREALIGRKCYQVFHDPESAGPPDGCPLVVMLSSGKLETAQMEIEALDGTFLVSTTPVIDEAGRLSKVIHIATDVTERKATENALRDRESRLSSLLRVAPTGIGVIRNRVISSANNRLSEMIGYTPEEVIGDDTSVLYPTRKEFDRVRRDIKRQLAENAIATVETQWKRKDGSIIDVLVHSTAVDPADRARGLMFTASDITERRHAVAALQKSEREKTLVLESVSELITHMDTSLRIKWANDAAAASVNTTCEELAGHHCYEVWHGRSEPCKECPVVKALASGQAEQGELGTPDGRMWSVHGYPVLDEHGRTVGAVEVTQNITERKRAEEELARYRYSLEELVKERTAELTAANERLRDEILQHERAELALKGSEKRFRAIAEAMPIPVLISSGSDGLILYANESLCIALGIPRDEFIGQRAPDFYANPEDRKAILDTLSRDGRVADYELQVKRADGQSLWAIVTIVPLTFQGEQCLFSGFYDITERKEMEEKLQELYDQERNLRQRLEEEMNRRVEFTRALAHELKTPLTPMVISSQVLESQAKGEPLLSLARNISRGAQNLNSRIDELLDMAKGEIGMLQLQPERLDIAQLLWEILNDVSPVASSRNLSLVSQLPASPLILSGDKVRLRQVVHNLLNNALKFTPEGGKITLRAKPDKGNLIVEVKDTGPGIPKDSQNRLFEPYQRLDDSDRLSGLGLGLHLCKMLVQLHGGRIWVKSQPGRGATFGFSIPLDTRQNT